MDIVKIIRGDTTTTTSLSQLTFKINSDVISDAVSVKSEDNGKTISFNIIRNHISGRFIPITDFFKNKYITYTVNWILEASLIQAEETISFAKEDAVFCSMSSEVNKACPECEDKIICGLKT